MLVIKGTRLLSFIVTISVVIIFGYFVLLTEIANHSDYKRRQLEAKKIVAYSLLKQIELESREFRCDRFSISQQVQSKKTRKLWTNLEGSNLHVYSWYLDRRLHPYRYVRIIAMVKGTWTDPLFCQILSSDGHYHITKATATKIWSKKWNQNDTNIYYNPFLISCHIPLNSTPVNLSLSKYPCKMSNQKFEISSELTRGFSKMFTICVKPLNFNRDISEHLLQWVTLNRVIGAEKIEFYVENLPRKTLKFLWKLEKFLNGSITVHRHAKIDFQVGFEQTRRVWQKRRYELIAYNDCLYRNIHTSHFVVPLDIDEIIIPRHVSTWAELLQEILSEGEDNFASYTVRNAYYLRRFNGERKKSKDMIFFFDDVTRSDFSDEGESGKSFVSTKNALTVFNHYALQVLKPGIAISRFLKSDLVQMNHYKDDCSIVILPECAKYLSSPVRIVDKIVFKYRIPFYQQYEKIRTLFKKKFFEARLQ